MKIAFIVATFPTLSETFILNQITGLLDLGHNVQIFALTNPNEGKIHREVRDYALIERTHYIPSIPKNKVKRAYKALQLIIMNIYRDPVPILTMLNIFKYGRSSLSLRKLFQVIPFLNREFDIIHCHFGPTGRSFLFLKDIIPGKYITSFHGYDVSSYVRRNGNRIYQHLFKKADLFTINSDHTKQRLEQLGCDASKIVKLPMGLNLDQFEFKLRKDPQGTIKVLTVARLVEKKGIGYSIRAVANVLERHPNIEYRIAGDGPLAEELGALISDLGISKKVHLLGWQGRKKVIKLMEESHIFILSSATAKNGDQEGQGLVLQEAQAMGLPIISTYHNGIPEGVIHGKSGFLVSERDVDALAEKLEYLIEHPGLCSKMGRFGRQFVEKRYNIKKLNQRLVKIYQNFIQGNIEKIKQNI